MGGTTTGASPAEERGRISLRPVLWRLHFLTGFLAGPILVWLCLTGILFAWNPQIESRLYRDALTAPAEGVARPLSEQVATVGAAYFARLVNDYQLARLRVFFVEDNPALQKDV